MFGVLIVMTLGLAACATGDESVKIRRSDAVDGTAGADRSGVTTGDSTPGTETTTLDSTPETQGTPPLVDSDGHTDTGQLAELVDAFTTMPQEQQSQELAALDAQTERRIWELNGVDDALGGSAAADAVFEGLYGAFADQRAAVGQEKIVLAAFRADDLTKGFGAALFGGLILQQTLGAAVVSASNDGKLGTGSTADGLFVSATANNDVTAKFDGSVTYEGATLHIKTEVMLNPCPDASGNVTVTSTSEASSAVGGASSGITVEVQSSIQVDDNADAAGSTYDFHVTREETSTSGTQHTIDVRISAGGEVKLAFRSWFESAELYSDSVKLGAFLAAVTNYSNVEAAKSGWQSGRCIDLQTAASDGPTGLDPSAKVTITAKPRAKADGAPAGGSVSALLAGGEAAVDPSSTPLKADAEFTYTAAAERDKAGQVSLESRSKRGVGKAVVNLDTKAPPAFSASGGGGEWVASGAICSLDAPFELSGSGLTATATPSGNGGGNYTLGGGAGGVPWDGSGTYTVSLAADGQSGTMTLQGVNTIHSPLGDYSDAGVATFTLTAVDPC